VGDVGVVRQDDGDFAEGTGGDDIGDVAADVEGGGGEGEGAVGHGEFAGVRAIFLRVKIATKPAVLSETP